MLDLPDAPAAADAVILAHDPPGASAWHAVLVAVARHLMTAIGAGLVAHGWLDPSLAGAVAEPIAQELAGAAMIAIATTAAGARARRSHNRWADAWAVLRGQAIASPPASGAIATLTQP